MKLTGAILVLGAATTVFAALDPNDPYLYKDCTFNTIRPCPGSEWESFLDDDDHCVCKRLKTDAEKAKDKAGQCNYFEELCYAEGIKLANNQPVARNSCGRLRKCNIDKFHKMCRKAKVEETTYQCGKDDIHLTASDKKKIADREAKKKAEEAKRKKDEADQEADGKKAYCKIIKPDCYERGSTHKNYNDRTNSCNQMKDNCSKEENIKLCADAKKNKWSWQCR